MKISKRRLPTDFGTSGDEAPGLAPQAIDAPLDADLADEFAQPDPQGALLREPAPAAPLSPPPSRGAVAQHGARTPVRAEPAPEAAAQDVQEAGSGLPVYLIALAVSVLWALAPIAFAVGYRGGVAPLQAEPFAFAIFALLAIGPAAFVFGAAYMIRQGQKLAAESRRAKHMADGMLTPALVAAARAGDVVQGVREEIARAGQAADQARDTLIALRHALADEAARLNETTQTSLRTAQDLAGALGRERSEMGALAQTLDAQATRVSDTITQQARMVAEASELADAQLREAEGLLSARAADLAAAAGEAGDAARTAGEDLVRHIARLETAGVGVSEQVRAVEGGLSEQRAALITLSHALRADHETFSNAADAHAAKLGEFISQARLSAAEMSDRASKGGETLKALMADAVEQFRELAETARAEREEFGQSTLHSLEAVSQAATTERAQLEAQTRAAIEALHQAAEETREAAARHAAMAREQVDQLSEAAFSAGQKANQVFEARLEEARALVDQSSKMVEDAGAATARKLDEGAAAARATMAELEAMFAELDRRAGELPAAARAQAEQVRATVVQGMDELMAHAHRTAAEAQAIDAAFQERVRRNFDMLSEAVRLMGTVAAAPPPVLAQPAPAAKAAPPPAVEAAPEATAQRTARTSFRAAYQAPILAATPAPVAAPEPAKVAGEADEELELSDLAPAPGKARGEGSGLADRLGLRPRLKLTPTATDQEFSSIFEAAGGPPQAVHADDDADDDGEGDNDSGDSAWTWKDLLASLDEGGEAAGAERLEHTLASELTRMGIEADKLLPKARIDEIAAAVQTGDLDGARQVVKRLAPAATRRIVRRLFTDADLKGQVTTYVRRYQSLVDEAAAKDPEGFLMASLLEGEAGKLYLLLDAACGDVS